MLNDEETADLVVEVEVVEVVAGGVVVAGGEEGVKGID